ncbi:xanthine dehydrogenase family protein molybdopterin-binding subunit [Halococcus salifodinae]|uniref:Carbon monoxide dehydrogenase n=1 Tax=Halococcus salifodinae DSM 8989 TaxID=1227456 RepID=M0N6Q9_9EURY|nr:xanthine dehydrogenase family protein molybdopterin-binding subunit [Halococcus salifodinae]EMA53243.1 carbon monoxide dehydrogenase [Halococcus salifodinae DSM 8989]
MSGAETGPESAPEPGADAGTDGRSESFTGSGLERVEDHRILTGEAEYVHDITPEGCLHMALLRTTHPHAEIESIDTSAAEDHPDCELVLTGADLQEEYYPMPCGLPGFEEWSLAVDRVRFVGEPVAAVVATDRYAAEDVVDEIDVEYETLDPVVDPRDALDDETIIHEDVGTNVPDGEEFVFGDVDAAFADADRVIEREYSWGRISGVPLETGGVVAEYDTEDDAFSIDCNIQLHTLVDDTVYETLGYPPERVSLDVPADVGGSFGTKIAIHRYCCLAAMASQQLDGTPVKFVEDRVENLQGGDMHSSDREYEVRLAVDDDGIIQGLDTWFVDDFGAWPHYPVNQALKPLSVLTDAYDISNVRYDYDLVLTNKTSQTAYRGFGVPPHLYAIEMIVDEAARELDLDPAELRRMNFVTPDQMPHEIASHNIYDSGDYPAALDHLRDRVEEREAVDGGLLDFDTVEARRDEGKYRGVSYTLHIEPGASGSDWTDRQRTDRDALDDRNREDVAELPEHLRAEITREGDVRAFLATDSSGQGHQTIVTQLLADELEVLPSTIEVEYLDSVAAPTEYGSAASRMAVMLSGAAQGLGATMKENLETLAAEEWGVDEDAVQYRDGAVERRDGDGSLDLATLAEIDAAGGRGSDRLTRASYDYEHPATVLSEFDEALAGKFPVYPTAAFAVNAPIVEVDTRTGEVEILKFYTLRDCGTQLNPVIVEGQAHGGIAQGIGAALMEEFGYDESGQPQAVTFFDYLLPSIKNVPNIDMDHSETPSPFTATGAKGTGEGGMIDAPASIASSINRALEPLGVVADRIPATPNRVHDWVRDAQSNSEPTTAESEDAASAETDGGERAEGARSSPDRRSGGGEQAEGLQTSEDE